MTFKKINFQEETIMKKFRCMICGYIHEADSLPEGFVCPLCKRGLEEFEELK